MPLSAKRVLRTFSYAMYFDGVDDYVYVPYSSSFDVRIFTLITWAYYTPKPFIDSYFVYKRNINHHLSMYVEPNTYLFVSAVTFTDGSTLYGKIDTRYTKSIAYVFRMYASRYNGTTFDIFIDATNYYTASPGKTVLTGAYPLYFGMRGSSYFNGFISQVLIYSRALSDSEIQWNYLYPDNPSRNGLVLWLRADPAYIKDINNDGVLEWIDLSGFGNHGKIYGARLVQLIKSASRILQAQRVLACAR
jgi:hypothetical protein